jgi:hypothetical protein
MAAAFITSLFSCPDLPPPSSNVTPSGAPVPSPKLANFIAYALHRTRLATCVTFAALFLLQRLKHKFPAARGSSGHRLFISAFMIASKVVCDDTYSNKSWAVVGQGMFQLKEINQMEREMCGYLEWQLNVDYVQLEEFTEDVQTRFGNGLLPIAPKSAAKLAVPTSSSTSIPAASSQAPASARREHFPHGAGPATPETLATSAGDDDEELESPSHSLTSSPADSALHTPPSNADHDGPQVIGPNMGMQGVTSSISAFNLNGTSGVAMSIPKVMATGGAPMAVDTVPPITAISAAGAPMLVNNSKLPANARGVFAEQAIW